MEIKKKTYQILQSLNNKLKEYKFLFFKYIIYKKNILFYIMSLK